MPALTIACPALSCNLSFITAQNQRNSRGERNPQKRQVRINPISLPCQLSNFFRFSHETTVSLFSRPLLNERSRVTCVT
jgi:hypothetical protein